MTGRLHRAGFNGTFIIRLPVIVRSSQFLSLLRSAIKVLRRSRAIWDITHTVSRVCLVWEKMRMLRIDTICVRGSLHLS